jgi:hypothetical protein
MLSNALVGLFAGLGTAGWVYNKVQRRTGGNTQNSLLVAGLAGLAAFIFIVTMFSILFSK